MRRQLLARLVKTMFLVIVVLFFYVLFRSLSPNLSEEQQLFENLTAGETAMRRFDGQRVWVSYLSESQKSNLTELSEKTVGLDGGCELTADYCIVQAATQRDGVELVFSRARPTSLLKSTNWYGGYIDPDSGAIYDLLARPYKESVDKSGVNPRQLETTSK